MLVICDIDGVVANNDKRLVYLERGDYDNFYRDEYIRDDELIASGQELVRYLGIRDERYGNGRPSFVYLTGRPEKTREATINWLSRNRISAPLFMRADIDHRRSETVKPELVAAIIGSYISYFGELPDKHILFVDDDPKNVKAVEEAFADNENVVVQGLVFGSKRLNEVSKNDKSSL